MNAPTRTPQSLPEPRIYQAMAFRPATEGKHPYSLHLVAAFDHADAVARLRAAGLIGAETYVLTDAEQHVERSVSSFVDEWRFEAPTVDEHRGWLEVMAHEVVEDGVRRGPTWIRIMP